MPRRSRRPRGVGRYEVEELIGAGGIGLVYAARDPELHRRVAPKVMRSSALPIGPAAMSARGCCGGARDGAAEPP